MQRKQKKGDRQVIPGKTPTWPHVHQGSPSKPGQPPGTGSSRRSSRPASVLDARHGSGPTDVVGQQTAAVLATSVHSSLLSAFPHPQLHRGSAWPGPVSTLGSSSLTIRDADSSSGQDVVVRQAWLSEATTRSLRLKPAARTQGQETGPSDTPEPQITTGPAPPEAGHGSQNKLLFAHVVFSWVCSHVLRKDS